MSKFIELYIIQVSFSGLSGSQTINDYSYINIDHIQEINSHCGFHHIEMVNGKIYTINKESMNDLMDYI